MSDNKNFGLGRLPAPDARDNRFPLRALAEPISPLRRHKYHYPSGWWGDQEDKPHCVGFSFAHYLEDGPITQKGKAPILQPSFIYAEAQKIDEWPGEDYEGTSVRAGAKVLQALGFIESYHWGFSLDDLIRGVFIQPVVVGTNWYSDMFNPNSTGLITASGAISGGHAYMINGVNLDQKLFRIKNSWGKSWGRNGHAFITFDDMAKLILEQGEICLAIESQKKSEDVEQ